MASSLTKDASARNPRVWDTLLTVQQPLPRQRSPNSRTENPIDADIAVIGAGPAGAAAALFAARRGLRVIVLDKQAFPRDKPCGEGLMPSGRPALRELGLEDAVIAGGAPALDGIQFGLAGDQPVAVPFPEHD